MLRKWLIAWLFPFKLTCEKIHPYARFPVRSTEHAAGYDLYAVEPEILQPGEQKSIEIGLKINFTPGWAAQIWDRSGHGAKGISKHAGLLDPDYPGEWKVLLRNHGLTPLQIEPGDRIAQVVFTLCATSEAVAGEVKQTTDRKGGFGSTGK